MKIVPQTTLVPVPPLLSQNKRKLTVNLSKEIFPQIKDPERRPVTSNPLTRVMVFTLSGSCIVDLKASKQMKSVLLTKFLRQIILQRKKTEHTDQHFTKSKPCLLPLTLSQLFQEVVEIQLFGQFVSIVHNDLLCVATFSFKKDINQLQLTRYFFSQFWCEFTPKVLEDFQVADCNISNQRATGMSETTRPSEEEIQRRNYFFKLFRIYDTLPFNSCVEAYYKVFSDVFILEKPIVVQRYFITEVNIVELNEQQLHSVFKYSFVSSTSRQVDYQISDNFQSLLLAAVKAVKLADLAAGLTQQELNKRGRKQKKTTSQQNVAKPKNGTEFYFSNCLIKIYQVPLLFTRSSEDKCGTFEGSFIILIFEKLTRKRTVAKSAQQQDRLLRQKAIFEKYDRKFEEELVFHRDSKMRRFCNYFVTLHNQKKLCPFTQFVELEVLNQIKKKVQMGIDRDIDQLSEYQSHVVSNVVTQRDEEVKQDIVAKEIVRALSVEQFESTYQKIQIADVKLKNDLSQRSFGYIGNMSRANMSSICHLDEVSEFQHSFKLQKRSVSIKCDEDLKLKCDTSLASLVDQIAKKEVSSLDVTERSFQRVGNAQGFNAPSERLEVSGRMTIKEQESEYESEEDSEA